ncbi:hypothetical protein ACFSUS_21590 [Spirosoma soli]|uniref:DUF2157 domain-containing protein n=1 Tax=Spirosoma soli TaxID=1770529 RepID=A0ABW5M8C0_9BACT
MRAYNEQWVYNWEVVRQSERWHRQKLLTDAQMAAIEQNYPIGFRRTNGFIEIGLFLFTTVTILGVYLLLNTIFSGLLSERSTYSIFNVVFGIFIGIVGQVLINRQQLYHNGVDNAFAVTLTGFLAFGLNQLLPTGLSVATHCLFTLPLLILVLWYYSDTLIAFLTLATFYAFVFDKTLDFSWGRTALPFIIMSVSLIVYFMTKRLTRLTAKQPCYTDSINLAQWIALVMLAAGGNYFVVRELNGVLLKPIPDVAPPIGLSGLFWLLTFAIPIGYIQQGLTRKNRMLIILGEVGLIGATMTIHKYVGLLALNTFLTVLGLALIGLAVAGIRYLRSGTPGQSKHGFTDDPDEDSPDNLLVNAQTIAAIQAASGTQQGPKDSLRFGGGEFGGGGSEGKY